MEQIIFWLAGAFGVPLVNALKKAFGFEGKAAVWLTAAVSAALALVAVLFSGAIAPGDFGPEQLFAAFGQVLAAAAAALGLDAPRVRPSTPATSRSGAGGMTMRRPHALHRPERPAIRASRSKRAPQLSQ